MAQYVLLAQITASYRLMGFEGVYDFHGWMLFVESFKPAVVPASIDVFSKPEDRVFQVSENGEV
jgi:hypothetical protein